MFAPSPGARKLGSAACWFAFRFSSGSLAGAASGTLGVLLLTNQSIPGERSGIGWA